MSVIDLLDNATIDQIAAGEVVDRPASVVKELVENAIDSGATRITVEIKNGGIDFIRVTDNGSGIYKDDVAKAFLRHATSKIKNIQDLQRISSMGFRGEALASIASVSRVELITKCESSLMGYHFSIEGSVSGDIEEIGAPNGTTFVIRNLFYNTPARRKFLKSEKTEAGVISDLMEHLALGRPDISFSYINNGKQLFSTTGKSNLKETIYRIYGRNVANALVPIEFEEDTFSIKGFLGKPEINKGNRNFETYFINHRLVQSDVIFRSIEEGYREYLMQHKFPFCVLHIGVDPMSIDVNVHPSKLDIRFHDKETVQENLRNAIAMALSQKEMIPECELEAKSRKEPFERAPEPFEHNTNRVAAFRINSEYEIEEPVSEIVKNNVNVEAEKSDKGFCLDLFNDIDAKEPILEEPTNDNREIIDESLPELVIEKPKQLNLFEEKILSKEAFNKYNILGQVFNTYWLISYEDKLLFVDQHAAHEKVNYERFMKRLRDDNICSQYLNPPIVISLSARDCNVLEEHIEYFIKLGFEIEALGDKEYVIRAIPLEMYSNDPETMFLDVLRELSEGMLKKEPAIILERIATMACKASVKGNMHMTSLEMEALINELLLLDNPYNCPHGRPTIFSISKYELEKKFKRVVD